MKTIMHLSAFFILIIIYMVGSIKAYTNNENDLNNIILQVYSNKTNRLLVGKKVAASDGIFNHQVQLFVVYTDHSKVTTCGGSIVHPNWILSAASCFPKGYKRILAVYGSTNLFDEVNRQTANVHDIIYPSNYSPGSIHGNVAMLRVDAIEYNDRVQNIALNFATDTKYYGLIATISGFGNLDENQPNAKGDLYYGTTSIINNCACANAMNATLNHLHMCSESTYLNSAVCNGDFGSGLINQFSFDNWRDYLLGVAIPLGNQTDCGQDTPNLYVDIRYYRKWIQNIIENYRPQ